MGGFVESRAGEFVAASADPVDGDVFGIAAIAPNVGTRKDRVADGEAGNLGTQRLDDSREIPAERQGKGIRNNNPRLSG